MSFTFQDPPLPSIARFRKLRIYGAQKTVLRRMELDLISDLDLAGTVLDFGGGTTTNYAAFLPKAATLRSVNISDEFMPTDLVKLGDPLLYPNAHFDAAITFNVLEHIYDDLGALTEVTRTIKPSGVLHIIVTWMYPVHGHPDDFNHHTPSWWATALASLGYAETSLLPLVFGWRTLELMIKGRGDKVIRGIVETHAALIDIAAARLRFRGGAIYTGRRGETVWASSPGWYIRAVKAA